MLKEVYIMHLPFLNVMLNWDDTKMKYDEVCISYLKNDVRVFTLGTLAKLPVCPSVGLPADGARQSNVLHGTKPMFVLDSRAVREGYLPGESYSRKCKQSASICRIYTIW